MAAAAIAFVSGCSTSEVEWTEEVQLSNGTIVVAERLHRYKRVLDVGAGFQLGWLYRGGRIKVDFPAPVSRSITWEGSLIPLALDALAGPAVYFVGSAAGRASRDEWKIPDDEMYAVFRLSSGGWERIPLKDLPAQAKPNLLVSTESFLDPHADTRLKPGSRIDLATKRKIDSRLTLSESLKTIVRPKSAAAPR